MTTEFILAPGEEFIQCPYNTAHQITNARFLTHLDKCRKAYIKDLTVEGHQKYMKICRHNACHHVPAPELRFHEERCVDAYSVVRHMAYHNSDEGNRKYEERRKHDTESRDMNYRDRDRGNHSSSSSSRRHSSSKTQAETKPAHKVTNAWGLQEEDWEAESAGNSAGYDPEQKLKTEFVMYNPSGLTKSERKKFRNEVRQKAAEVSLKGEPVELPTSSSFDIKPNITDLKIKDEGGRTSPPEPGEIEDDDDEHGDRSHSRSGERNRHSENNHSRRNSHDYNRPSSSSSSSSRPYYSSNHTKSSNSRSGNFWTESVERAKEEYYPDSDDFEGIDPYI